MRHIVQRARPATAVILGLLLVLSSIITGLSHVHAAPLHEKASGLHVDHVHLDSDQEERHDNPGATLELTADHSGDDAVTLSWAGYEATPRRVVPCLAASDFSGEPPETPSAVNHDGPGAAPIDPPLRSRPSGRAPPA